MDPILGVDSDGAVWPSSNGCSAFWSDTSRTLSDASRPKASATSGVADWVASAGERSVERTVLAPPEYMLLPQSEGGAPPLEGRTVEAGMAKDSPVGSQTWVTAAWDAPRFGWAAGPVPLSQDVGVRDMVLGTSGEVD